ncbi:MAG: hypothetical protein ACOYL5_16725 [Phototrophicaceae bacterium]
MKLKARAMSWLTLLLTLMLGVILVAAQETPTTAPTKTPTAIPPSPTEVASPTVVATTPPMAEVVPLEEPFIQADLQILSGNVQRPNGLFWHNGMVYASCNGDWTIYEIAAQDGATTTYLWGIRNSHTMYVETDSANELNLWLPDYQTNQLVRIYQRSVQPIADDLNGPWGIVMLDESDFLVTNLLGNEIVQISREGEKQVVATGFRSPTGIAIQEGRVFVANNGSARRGIEWFAAEAISDDAPLVPSEDDNSAIQPLIGGLQSVTGLTVASDGYLYFAYSLGTRGVVGRVDPQVCIDKGGCSNSDVEIVVYSDLAAPLAGLTVSPDMTLYLHSIFSPELYYVDLTQPPASVSAATTS